jgi:hypothetical protein
MLPAARASLRVAVDMRDTSTCRHENYKKGPWGNVRRGFSLPGRILVGARYPLRGVVFAGAVDCSVSQAFFGRDIERIDDLLARRAFKVRLASVSFRPRPERTSMRATGD